MDNNPENDVDSVKTSDDVAAVPSEVDSNMKSNESGAEASSPDEVSSALVDDAEERPAKPPEPIGRRFLDAALANIYDESEPTLLDLATEDKEAGAVPLIEVRVHAPEEPVPHWHYVTYGFTELDEKESDNADVNGFGFELTFRLGKNEPEPPSWPGELLAGLARYVFNTGHPFDVGHHLTLNGPIKVGAETAITAVVFAEDPALGEIECPHGAARFVQVVGITEDERTAIRSWDAGKFIELLAGKRPFLITDLGRASVLDDEEIGKAVVEGRENDGSSTGALTVGELSWEVRKSLFKKSLSITLGIGQVDDVRLLLPNRIKHGNTLIAHGPEQGVKFIPDEKNHWSEKEEILDLHVTVDTIEELAGELTAESKTITLKSFPKLTFSLVD